MKSLLGSFSKKQQGKGKGVIDTSVNIDELSNKIDELLDYLQYYISLYILEFYHFISIFMVPLSVFRSKTDGLERIAIEFFTAKIKAMQEHERELTSMGIKTNDMGNFIKTM